MIDSATIQEFRLQPERAILYQDFYYTLVGLPMSLGKKVESFDTPIKRTFNGLAAFQLPVVLSKPMISANWNLYFSESNFQFLGLEMVFPEDATKGERIIFAEEFDHWQMKLFRAHHWYDLTTGAYAGADILLAEIE